MKIRCLIRIRIRVGVRVRVMCIHGSSGGIDAIIIISTRCTGGTLPGIDTLPGCGDLMNDSSRRGARRARARRASLKKTSQETTGVGIAAQLEKKRAVGNQVIDGIADKASARGTSSTRREGCNQEVIGTKGGSQNKGVNRD
jgi:hypothetical protein